MLIIGAVLVIAEVVGQIAQDLQQHRSKQGQRHYGATEDPMVEGQRTPHDDATDRERKGA